MALVSYVRSLRQSGLEGTEASAKADLRAQTETFCGATTLTSQTGRLIDLFSGIFQQRPERVFRSRLNWWLEIVEQEADLRSTFR